MREPTYRSCIDKLVCESGLKGTAVACEMGITVNRIVALRRGKDENITDREYRLCRAAIIRLGGKVTPTPVKDVAQRLDAIDNQLSKIIDLMSK
jgi:DNA-binding Xre family transcriptional regulator